MKKKKCDFAKKITSVVIIGIVSIVVFVSCSFPLQSGMGSNAQITDINERLTFSEISRQGFMGGSVLYNPDKPATGQLAKGVSVAIRLGYILRNDVTAEQAVFSDILEEAQFGKLYVTDIGKDVISFTVQLFNFKGEKLSSAAYRVNIDEQIDINNDGLPDIEYKKPLRKRVGFESAIYLTFLSSQETLNTSMFAVLPAQYSRGVYPSGIIGINPQDRMIVQKYEDDNLTRAMIYGLQNGDYVLDNQSGLYYTARNISDFSSSRTIDDNELISESDFGLDSFYYSEKDFDIYTTPQLLLSALPHSVTGDCYGVSNEDVITQLNEILKIKNLVEQISECDNDVLNNELSMMLDNVASFSEYELVSFNRFYLNDKYESLSPQIDTGTADITEVLPLYSCIIGEENNGDLENINSRATTFSGYEVEKQKILAKFNSYKKIPIIPSLPAFETKDISKLEASMKVDNTLVKPNVRLDFGIYGSFSITFSNVDAKLASAVFLQVETICSLSQSYSISLLPTGPINIPTFSIPIQCGPVAITFNCSLGFDIPLNFGGSMNLTSNFFAGFVGMYGGEINAGANYGMRWVEWFKIWRKWVYRPEVYFEPYFRANVINNTAYYIGPTQLMDIDSINVPLTVDYNAYMSLCPTLNVIPTLGIPILKASFPASTGLEGKVNLNYTNKSKTLSGIGSISFFYDLKAKAEFGVSLPFNIGFRKFSPSVTLAEDSILLGEWNLL